MPATPSSSRLPVAKPLPLLQSAKQNAKQSAMPTTPSAPSGTGAWSGADDLRRPATWRLKRGLDLAVTALVALPALPLIALIAVLVKLDSRGPVLFRQQRLGRGGRLFAALKFRTMHVDAEARLAELLEQDPALRAEYAEFHKLRHDPRVTRLGRWLRMFSLDELPQFWNVLRGEMNLVGPRAYIPAERARMNGADAVILQVPPGITGLWQTSGRNALPFSERVRLDAAYVRHWRIRGDLRILLRTPGCVIRRDGAW